MLHKMHFLEVIADSRLSSEDNIFPSLCGWRVFWVEQKTGDSEPAQNSGSFGEPQKRWEILKTTP